MASFSEALEVKKQIVGELLKDKDIFGVGVGYYDPNDQKKGAGIIIYSQKVKASIATIPKALSATAKGKKISVPVRVVKNDSFKANIAINSTKFKKKIRPVQGGYSIGTPNWSGTAGLIVSNYPNRKRLYVLSNNHVINKNNSAAYTETTQPGGSDGGKSGRDRIGSLYRFVKLKKNSKNYIDAAIAIPLKKSFLTPKYAIIGKVPGHYVNYKVGWKFIIVGRTTGLVGGRVESINTDVKINYGNYGGLDEVSFEDQTIIRSNHPISLPGDSGSVWLYAKNYYATAVNYAGTPDGKLSVSFPVHWAMQAFGIRVANYGKSSSRILRLNKHNSKYTRPLSKKELGSIKIIKSKT